MRNAGNGLRVALISSGNADYAAQLAQGLSSHCSKVVLILNQLELNELLNGVPVFFKHAQFSWFGFKSFGRRIIPLTYLTGMLIAFRVLREKCQIAHVISAGTRQEMLIAVKLLKLFGITIVLTLHDVQFHPGDLFRLQSVRILIKILDRSHRIITHGKFLTHAASKSLLVSPEFSENLAIGGFTMYREHAVANTSGKQKKTLLFFGRMKYYKGLSVLEKALPAITAFCPDTNIIIAGTGPDLDCRMIALGAIPNVTIINRYCSAQDVGRLFSGATLCLFPYLEASQSGALSISFAFGVPVIATNVGSLPEVIEHGVHGLMIPPDNPVALTDAICHLLRDPKKLAMMHEACLKHAETVLSWEKTIAPGTIRAYHTAMAAKREHSTGKLTSPAVRRERWQKVVHYYRTYCSEILPNLGRTSNAH